MSRSLPEWHGKTDDSAVPPRVKDRVSKVSNDCCVECRRPIGGKLRPEFDHIVALVLGGSHREANLQLLCNECHSVKTKRDVKLKARVSSVRQKRIGIKARKRTIPGRRFNGDPIPSKWVE